MVKNSLFITLIAIGCGKSSPDKMCTDMCDDFQAWSDECVPLLDPDGDITIQLDSHETCLSDCIDGYNDADEKNCDVQFKAYVNCMNSVGFDELECNAEVFMAEAITACATQMAALNSCTDDSEGSTDTGPS